LGIRAITGACLNLANLLRTLVELNNAFHDYIPSSSASSATSSSHLSGCGMAFMIGYTSHCCIGFGLPALEDINISFFSLACLL
jgi:hypothetical protein